jgi:hypothetical protein
MPGVDYTTTSLISSIKRRISLPDAQNLYSPDDLIAFMGDELSSTIVPLVHSVQQEYWVQQINIPLIQNQTNYTIPIRGAANGLRLVTLVDNNGNEIDYPMLRPENTASSYNWLSPYSTSTLYGFYMEGDHIVMFPNSVVTNPVNTIRFRIERQPSQLCATSEAAQITAIAGQLVTVNGIPSDWTTSLLYDIMNGQPQFQPKIDDAAISNLNFGTSVITFTTPLPSNLAVGDWISIQNTAPIPQIPYQMFPYLAQCVATKCLEGLSDTQVLQAAQQKLGLMKEDLLKLLQPRDMGNVQTVVNRGGLFDNGQFWGWGSGNYWLLFIGLSLLSHLKV